ncbi:maltooligosyl trehalose synthase [Austwickia chelonae]|uniref:Malto-oligosyltrehalose synthase n=1 Tax=Austwickia chelonae NBRC 105200 TaxID=1184607 RepID=K6VM30_9MICO|nr:malto-oligosyltrehalose synthase [Austwickia chelonae]GAB77799.1 malto-oligosyltrehalose synthase [Austwickia chelonae NBRC 105200]SEV89734.1 maltooligosyl trehalose synthase [Austwickia chelonae]
MPVTGTYRLQLHRDFGFADAARIVPYLARLGVSHLYLSPILASVAGSMHGYDVVDHSRVDEELGGRAGFEELAALTREHGMGIVVDVVPNHMAFVAPESANIPLWEVLRDGRDARTAQWFDIDWKAGGGRIGLPFLGGDLDTVLEAEEIVLDRMPDPVTGLEIPVLRYYDHVLPVALGTEGNAEPGSTEPAVVRAILDRQHYRLTSWRDKDDSLNYRRFFEVDGLIAVRVELPEVFEETHRLLLELNHAGLIDGFRIDHPDGLADPTGYLDRLRRATTRGTYLVVEKILEKDERLPDSWACDGTTGYDAMRAVAAALVDTGTASVLTREWELAGGDATLAQATTAAKRQVVDQALTPEVERLVRRARESLPESDPDRLREAVVELLVAGEVYRAYVRAEERLSPAARERLTDAFTRAIGERPDLDEELRALVPLTVADDSDANALDFAVRLQQTWGPVMAKGIEDTTFYRWHRLIALNEVGGDPEALETASVDDLHRWAVHQAEHWPRGMTSLSTHDTKRSEDVRARLLAVAGDAQAWSLCSRLAREQAEDFGIDLPTAHLLWQTLLGVGYIAPERITDYLLKALREAKQHTAWVDGDEAYEQRVLAFVEQVRVDGRLHDAIDDAVTRHAEAIRATVLGAKALQLTLPGVPDCYQGCELVDLSLVDPDNRRPVDYDRRAALLERLATQGVTGLPTEQPDRLDAEKLLVTSRLMALRREESDLFLHGSYRPLPTPSDHLIGLVREQNVGRLTEALGLAQRARLVTLVTRAPAALAAEGGWTDTVVTLPDGPWQDVLTGRAIDGGETRVAGVLGELPVAVLLQR